MRQQVRDFVSVSVGSRLERQATETHKFVGLRPDKKIEYQMRNRETN